MHSGSASCTLCVTCAINSTLSGNDQASFRASPATMRMALPTGSRLVTDFARPPHFAPCSCAVSSSPSQTLILVYLHSSRHPPWFVRNDACVASVQAKLALHSFCTIFQLRRAFISQLQRTIISQLRWPVQAAHLHRRTALWQCRSRGSASESDAGHLFSSHSKRRTDGQRRQRLTDTAFVVNWHDSHPKSLSLRMLQRKNH
jgi:hypothetical protein